MRWWPARLFVILAFFVTIVQRLYYIDYAAGDTNPVWGTSGQRRYGVYINKYIYLCIRIGTCWKKILISHPEINFNQHSRGVSFLCEHHSVKNLLITAFNESRVDSKIDYVPMMQRSRARFAAVQLCHEREKMQSSFTTWEDELLKIFLPNSRAPQWLLWLFCPVSRLMQAILFSPQILS